MTINSPDDIGGSLPGGHPTPSPVTGDIDWLRSVTETRVERTAVKPKEKHVKHTAVFGIKPGAVIDVLAEYSRTINYQPRFLYAEWNDGVLTAVRLSGPQRLKSGDTSDKLSRHRSWNDGWRNGVQQGVDKADLPAPVADALTAYETAIAVAANGGAK